jgi:hypothetical protein
MVTSHDRHRAGWTFVGIAPPLLLDRALWIVAAALGAHTASSCTRLAGETSRIASPSACAHARHAARVGDFSFFAVRSQYISSGFDRLLDVEPLRVVIIGHAFFDPAHAAGGAALIERLAFLILAVAARPPSISSRPRAPRWASRPRAARQEGDLMPPVDLHAGNGLEDGQHAVEHDVRAFRPARHSPTRG